MSIGTKQERNENSVVVCMDFLFLKLIYKEIDNVIGKLNIFCIIVKSSFCWCSKLVMIFFLVKGEFNENYEVMNWVDWANFTCKSIGVVCNVLRCLWSISTVVLLLPVLGPHFCVTLQG